MKREGYEKVKEREKHSRAGRFREKQTDVRRENVIMICRSFFNRRERLLHLYLFPHTLNPLFSSHIFSSSAISIITSDNRNTPFLYLYIVFSLHLFSQFLYYLLSSVLTAIWFERTHPHGSRPHIP